MANSLIKGPAIKTKAFSASVTIEGSSTGTMTITPEEIALTGYTPIGVVGVNKTGSAQAYVVVYRFGITSTGNLQVGLTNTTDTSKTTTVTATVLYQRQ